MSNFGFCIIESFISQTISGGGNFMRKILTVLLALTLIFTFTACANSRGTNDGTNNGSSLMPDNNMQGSSTPLTSDSENRQSSAQIKITEDEAKSIALKDAGLSADAVTFIRSEIDRDDGVLKYEVEFSSNGVEYEYDINADSGKILWVDKDFD